MPPPSSRQQHESGNKQNCAHFLLHDGFLLGLTFDVTRWRRYVPPKHLLSFNRLCVGISLNTDVFAVKLHFQPVNAVRETVVFTVGTIRNTQIHCAGRMQSSVIYTNSVRTSKVTQYISATEPNHLMLLEKQSCLLWEPYGTHRYTV
jgi:hypothetical protein